MTSELPEDCGACATIKRWAKKALKTAFKPAKNSPNSENTIDVVSIAKAIEEIPSESVEEMPCPPDASEIGSSTWTFLHTMSVYYPEQPSDTQKRDMSNFIDLFSKFYPCGYCATHLRNTLKRNRPTVSSRQELAEWFCKLHNEVNERTGKPKFDCSKVFERWKTGCSE